MKYLLPGIALLAGLSSASAEPICSTLGTLIEQGSTGWDGLRGESIPLAEDEIGSVNGKWHAPSVGTIGSCTIVEEPALFSYSCFQSAADGQDLLAATRDVARKLLGICLEESDWQYEEKDFSDAAGKRSTYAFWTQDRKLLIGFSWVPPAGDASPASAGVEMRAYRDDGTEPEETEVEPPEVSAPARPAP